jgi:hypothetical protein
VAEVERGVLGKRLRERIGDKTKLAGACDAFERERNRAKSGVNWRSTTANAPDQTEPALRNNGPVVNY